MTFNKKISRIFIVAFVLVSCRQEKEKTRKNEFTHPNIVYILADDLGYGDVSAYNPGGKIKTPHIDQLASEGMRFTDAHAPSSVCTPTRYSILTGRYCWRSRLPRGVLQGYGRALIEKGRPTVASMLKSNGYTTAVIGKWHLGLDWKVKKGHDAVLQLPGDDQDGAKVITNMDPEDIDFTVPPGDGPLSHGFDYSYILPASLDMAPYCYLENDTLTELPAVHTDGNDLNTGFTGAFWRAGLMAPGFKIRQVLPNFTMKTMNYIKEHKESPKPFFIYFAMTAPHTPWLPSAEFTGKSQAGDYGDFVVMVDHMVGKVLNALKENGLEQNTIVFFASDNGPFWKPEFIEKFNHHAAYIYRGMKADAWEGGHRIPFIIRWPGHIIPGSVSDATTTLANLMATSMDILGDGTENIPGEDSYSILPVLLGKATEIPGQNAIVHESSGGMFAVRRGPWKLIEGRGSGGFSKPVFYAPKPGEPVGQLYNLQADPSETRNLYQEDSGMVMSLSKVLDSIRLLKK